MFVLGSTRGLRCGACFNVVWNQEREKLGIIDKEHHDTEKAVQVAVEAMKNLICKDKKKEL